MKKIIFLVFIAVLFFGCTRSVDKSESSQDPHIPPMLKYTKDISGENSNLSDELCCGKIIRVLHFTYNGHQYIQFNIAATHGGKSGIVHDPDCPCQKN